MQYIKHLKAISLIELASCICIVSISLTSMIMAYYHVSKSPSPNTQQQATNIASNYLSEILSKNFPTTLPCPTPPTLRSNYTNICDYNGLVDVGAKDQNDNAIAGLENYTILINLTTSTNAVLGTLTGGSTAATAKIVRIDVTVKNPGIPNTIISAYRGKY